MQVNEDGTVARNLALVRSPPYDACAGRNVSLPLALAGAEQIYVAQWDGTNVNGFPRRGLARLFTNPPERDFRVFTPAECSRSSVFALVRVVRTGPTTNAASVAFTTRDETAKAGEDYGPQSGTLNFAPLEVSKEVAVPLLAHTPISGCRVPCWRSPASRCATAR